MPPPEGVFASDMIMRLDDRTRDGSGRVSADPSLWPSRAAPREPRLYPARRAKSTEPEFPTPLRPERLAAAVRPTKHRADRRRVHVSVTAHTELYFVRSSRPRPIRRPSSSPKCATASSCRRCRA